MTIDQIQDEVIEEFYQFDDWMGKYELLIDFAKDMPVIDEKFKTDENLVRGCQARVWLHAELKGGNLHLTADSDALITKGLVALVLRILSGHLPEEVLHSDLYFIDKIGLKEHLSPTRNNGLASMIKQIKIYAVALGKKE